MSSYPDPTVERSRDCEIVLGHNYRIREPLKIVDGDTADLQVGLGFWLTRAGRYRLLGYDTPERAPREGSPEGRAFEKERAREARTVADGWFFQHQLHEVWMHTEKDEDAEDDFGRYLARIWCEDCLIGLGEHLANENLATTWPLRWRTVFGLDSGAGGGVSSTPESTTKGDGS